MIWLENLENIAESKTSGKCPHCGSDNTDYTLVGEVGNIGYGEVWCNDCKCAYHISRIQIAAGHPLNKKTPNNLIYK